MAKLDYAINAVLLLAYVATGRATSLACWRLPMTCSRYLAPRQARAVSNRMLEMLYAVSRSRVEHGFARALGYLAVKMQKRALVVIFTDLSGGRPAQALVTHLPRCARHLPLVVTISDSGVVLSGREPWTRRASTSAAGGAAPAVTSARRCSRPCAARRVDPRSCRPPA